MIKIEKYQSIYFNDCLRILLTNTPKYIDPTERLLYENYLSRNLKAYFVLFDKQILVACGGYELNKQKTIAGLCWGLVDHKYHKNGYGTTLLHYRIKHIKSNYGNLDIKLDTSQKTYKFFKKFGFKVEKITPNKYGVDLDSYDMVLEKSLVNNQAS
jgi:ribosomal protein S18 acetylase RimI-like enzyme